MAFKLIKEKQIVRHKKILQHISLPENCFCNQLIRVSRFTKPPIQIYLILCIRYILLFKYVICVCFRMVMCFFVLSVFVLCLVYPMLPVLYHTFTSLFVFVLCLVYPMLPVSLDCPFFRCSLTFI